MAINDQNRARKVYSFFRPPPVAVNNSRINVLISSSINVLSGGSNLLVFPTVASLGAYNVTTGLQTRGSWAYVQSVRDYFTLEAPASGSATPPLANPTGTRVVAATGGDANTGTWWFRTGIGSEQWSDQLEWFVDGGTGNDENTGNTTASPLATLDELTLRLLAKVTLKENYVINCTAPISTSVGALLGLKFNLDGGSVIMNGYSPTSYGYSGLIFSSTIGTNTGGVTGSINYGVGAAHLVSSSGVHGDTADYVALFSGNTFIGWSLGGSTDKIFTTACTSSIAVGSSINAGVYPTVRTNFFEVDGQGTVTVNRLSIKDRSSNIDVVVSPGAQLQTNESEFNAVDGSLRLWGGPMLFNNSRLGCKASTNRITVERGSSVGLHRSAFSLPTGSTSTTVNVKNSRIEIDSTTLWATTLTFVGSRGVFGNRSTYYSGITGAPGGGDKPMSSVQSTIRLWGDSVVDVGNAVTTTLDGTFTATAYEIIATGTDPGPGAKLLYAPTQTAFLPVSGTIRVPTGTGVPTTENLTWSAMPWTDDLKDCKIIKGFMSQEILNATVGGD